MKKRRSRVLPNLYLILILAVLYLPMFVVIAYSFNAQKDGLRFTEFTLSWYEKLWSTRQMTEAMLNSLLVAVISCLAAAVIGTLGALGMARRKTRGAGFLATAATLPIMLPEVILGLAFLVSFSFFGLKKGLLSTVLAHTAFCTPYVFLLVRARLTQKDDSLEEAARDLGASPTRVLFTITLPELRPAILSGVFLAFAMSLDDFVISFFVQSADFTTYPVYVYGRVKTSVPPTVNAMCTVMLGITLLAVALSQIFQKRRKNP